MMKRRAKGQICPNQTFFKSLESFQSVDIKNDIGFSIWRYKLKVMMKIKVGEQVLECLNQNYKGWNLFKSNVFSKNIYLKWTCILNLRVKLKVMMKRKDRGQISLGEQVLKYLNQNCRG